MPSDGAAVWTALNWPAPWEKSGSRMTAARVTAGAISLSNSSHLAPMLYFLQRLQEGSGAGRCFRIVRGQGAEHADAPHSLWLLRVRRERPCRRRTTEQRDELAALCM